VDPSGPDIDGAYERCHIQGVAIAEALFDGWDRLQAEMPANPPLFMPPTPEEDSMGEEEIANTLRSMARSRHHK